MLLRKLAWDESMQSHAITPADLTASLSSGAWSFLPGRAKDGGVVLLAQVGLWNPHEYTLEEMGRMLAYVFFQAERMTKNDPACNGQARMRAAK